MLKQSWRDVVPHRIKNKIHSFGACQFGCGNKVHVTSDQHNPIHLLFQSQSGDVDADLHIHTFLAHVVDDIVFLKISDGSPAAQ